MQGQEALIESIKQNPTGAKLFEQFPHSTLHIFGICGDNNAALTGILNQTLRTEVEGVVNSRAADEKAIYQDGMLDKAWDEDGVKTAREALDAAIATAFKSAMESDAVKAASANYVMAIADATDRFMVFNKKMDIDRRAEFPDVTVPEEYLTAS